ncbi:hypothetical protein TrLO_g20 [Triparma laevis f. longispina]|uniref:non-specific serine/threonine protein kinase n=1 Tax=Triparma laevis f. longispina TaxID=1714387 RepID=A0A9W7EAR5_9STRA|nr:hypothetical protein TrLO_g20 [Triparma laevis f. longispina]
MFALMFPRGFVKISASTAPVRSPVDQLSNMAVNVAVAVATGQEKAHKKARNTRQNHMPSLRKVKMILPLLLLLLPLLTSCQSMGQSTSYASPPPLFLIDVEGTLHGLSRTSGTLLWSTPLSSPLNSNPTPLLSTTITTGTITFIPSITGSIHLPRDPNSNPNPNLNNSDQKNKKINNVRSTNEVVYDTVSVRDLVSRSPFVDYQGRVFAGSKRGQAVGVDYRNGVVKKVVDGGGVFDVVDEDSDSYNEDNYGEEEFIVWVGRNDYDVTVYDIHSGRIESLFSSSEVLSSKEMLSLAGGEARESEEQETSSIRLLATVQGAIVMVSNDNESDPNPTWVASPPTISPLAYAIDPLTNLRIPITLIDESTDSTDSNRVIVKKMKGGGIYAVPVSKNSRKGTVGKSKVNKELLQHSRKTAGKRAAQPKLKPATSTSPFTPPSACTPKSPNYPSCLIGHTIPVELDATGSGTVRGADKLVGNNNVDTFTSAMQLQQFHDLYHTLQKEQRRRGGGEEGGWRVFMGILSSWVPPVVALIFVVSFEMGRRKRLQHLKVDNPVSSSSSSSSLEKINNDEQPQPQSLSSSKQIGSITLSSTILGYGCHGTVVFLGSLHNRKIAVKRMLSAYDASASNEIDLLCRTDDHANLIRYFMRETDGEFVYLALELCDKSLLDAVEGGICGGEVGALEEIVKGVDHLHNMRIIHRDIKPQNILMRKKGKEQKHFGDYLMKISDMGLGKVVGGGQSGSSMGGGGAGGVPSSTGGGGGAGSVGWQAQEVIKQKLERVASSENLGESAGGSAVRVSSRSRFASDIFSLGCLFQFVLLPGSHPFGSFYERENNIILGKPVELRKLLSKNPLAYNLVKSMVQHDYKLRPTASQVLKHPFFWSKTKRMQFICDFSDRLEIEGAVSKLGLKVEVAAADIISTNFTNKMEPKLLNDAAKYRSYDPASVVDCLRFIRNKRNHEDSIPSDVKQKIGSLWEYFENLFPGLVGRCWEVSKKELSAEDEFCKRWELDGEGVGVEAVGAVAVGGGVKEVKDDKGYNNKSEEETNPNTTTTTTTTTTCPEILVSGSGVVIWNGSDAAAAASNGDSSYGWWRSADDFEALTSSLSKQGAAGGMKDSNSHLNNVDPRFRTRLCTNWLASNGTSCAMKDKGKCIFAHSPCELRVKEGKRARWGKLINKETGYSSNLLASGGEDTYGAAIGVESMREQEGKWGGGGGQGGRRGGRGRGGGRYGGRGGRGRGKCY